MKQTAKYHLAGTAPLLMHNGRLSDPHDPWSKAIKKISAKSKKTDADHEEMGRLEWHGSLYLADEVPCIPMQVIKATLLRAAMTLKKGPRVKAGVVCQEHALLEYNGPRDFSALWLDDRFRDRRPKAMRGVRVIRTRPVFFPWEATIVLAFSDELVNPQEVDEFVTIAGTTIGFCDERPDYGRFSVHKL